MIFDTISVEARWEQWCQWNCDMRVINARKKKRHFLSYRKRRHDAQVTWPYAYYVTLGSRCKMASSSSEDETDTLPETHKDTTVSLSAWACQAGFWKSTGTSCQLWHAVFHCPMGFAKSHSLKCSLHKWAQCGAARKSARLNRINLIYFRLTAGRLRGSSCIVIPGVICELLQFAATQ